MLSYFTAKNFFRAAELFCVSTIVFMLSCNQSETVADSNEPPEENRFTKVVLTEGFDEPIAMTFLNDVRVLIIERKV